MELTWELASSLWSWRASRNRVRERKNWLFLALVHSSRKDVCQGLLVLVRGTLGEVVQPCI
eukprot:1101842-Amorphochlora_amoeboformis.AAC.1